MYAMKDLLERISGLSSSGKSWGEIASILYPYEDREQIRLVLWRIAKDNYYPKDNHLRKRLELPALQEVEACPNCGEVHIARCPKVDTGDIPTAPSAPLHITVIVMKGGTIPDGAQVISADQCRCGDWFISKSRGRKRCFKCSPYRGKKAEGK